jgi:septum formation protein
MTKIILASSSPRRKELLSLAGIEYDVMSTDVDESVRQGITPHEAVSSLSLRKAEKISGTFPERIVLAADTLVAIDGIILGKPCDQNQAYNMLKQLSGKTHSVLTGVTIAKGDKIINFVEETSVSFYDLSDEEINQYVQSGEPMDKAGSYAIQGKGCVFVKAIEGDYFNVVGLPIARTVRLLREFKDEWQNHFA